MIESLSNEINESGEQESAASKHRGKQQLSAVVDGDDGAEQGMDASAERIGWRVHLDLKCLMWNNRQALGAATRSPQTTSTTRSTSRQQLASPAGSLSTPARAHSSSATASTAPDTPTLCRRNLTVPSAAMRLSPQGPAFAAIASRSHLLGASPAPQVAPTSFDPLVVNNQWSPRRAVR